MKNLKIKVSFLRNLMSLKSITGMIKKPKIRNRALRLLAGCGACLFLLMSYLAFCYGMGLVLRPLCESVELSLYDADYHIFSTVMEGMVVTALTFAVAGIVVLFVVVGRELGNYLFNNFKAASDDISSA